MRINANHRQVFFSSAFEYVPRAMKVEGLGWRYENDFIGIQSLAQRLPSVGFGDTLSRSQVFFRKPLVHKKCKIRWTSARRRSISPSHWDSRTQGRMVRGRRSPGITQASRTAAVGNMIGEANAIASCKEVRVSVGTVDLIASGGFGKMVCLREECVRAVAIVDAIGKKARSSG
jgi:hypothetical protein